MNNHIERRSGSKAIGEVMLGTMPKSKREPNVEKSARTCDELVWERTMARTEWPLRSS
jgi:hypothetical protein